MKCWSTRSVTALQDITAAFDKESNVPVGTSAHFSKSDEHDVSQVASLLLKNPSTSGQTWQEALMFPEDEDQPPLKLE